MSSASGRTVYSVCPADPSRSSSCFIMILPTAPVSRAARAHKTMYNQSSCRLESARETLRRLCVFVVHTRRTKICGKGRDYGRFSNTNDRYNILLFLPLLLLFAPKRTIKTLFIRRFSASLAQDHIVMLLLQAAEYYYHASGTPAWGLLHTHFCRLKTCFAVIGLI